MSNDVRGDAPPDGACDSHVHVFHGSVDAAIDRPTPNLLLASLDQLGFDRAVVVSSAIPGTAGSGNAATARVLSLAPERLRGIALLSESSEREQIELLGTQGFVGARFSYMDLDALRAGRPMGPRVDRPRALTQMATVMREIGWQAHIFGTCSQIVAETGFLATLQVPVVIDHMGWLSDTSPRGATFREFVAAVKAEGWWVKLSALRNGPIGALDSVRPFHDALLEAAPDRMIWGSDWPFVGMPGGSTSSRILYDQFARWTPDADLLHAVLVTNPAELFGF
ncbi:amidohydrolase family protein [Aeromicrobium alkaliterrae]|uniref:Amidohydrolase family protein n=1 Tax=Aeromicrobium alkaliterrae TaxID=302168 RepID=A0ABP4WGV5_9ACTN